MSESEKYFHEITADEWEKIKSDHWTWGAVAKEYAQPGWCGYAGAVHGLGCWALVAIGGNYRITKEDDCKECDLYRGR